MANTFFSIVLDPRSDTHVDDPAIAPQLQAERTAGFARLLAIIACCWLAYVLVLFLVDTLVISRTPQLSFLPLLYYLLHASVPLIVLGIAISSWAQQRIGSRLLPFVIFCLVVLPPLITALVAPFAIGPIAGTRGLVMLRFSPVVLVGIVLVAWNYSWNEVVRWNLVLLLLLLVPAIYFPEIITTTIVMALLHTVGFLTISYCINTLVGRLRHQSIALRQANRQLRQYASTLEHLTISRERNRVARELHDTLAHTLSSLSVQLETVKAYWDVDPKTAQALLDTALATTRSGLHETRRALDALRARPLDDVGLRIALYDMIVAATELANLKLELVLPDELPVLDAGTEQAIYRIAQEAVANVIYHAEAQDLGVIISCTETIFMMQIRDNGRGFGQEQSRAAGHFGLAGMHERATLIGATLSISSTPATGTLVELILPFDEREQHASVDL